MNLTREQLLDAYRTMRTIRVFEEKLWELVQGGKLAGFLHLYAGEEAVGTGVCSHLDDRDVITSNHRGHGHCIAKGVDVEGMMAELYGRSTGLCKGKGGSMHIADMDKGMLGANGIVGAGIPLTDRRGPHREAQEERRCGGRLLRRRRDQPGRLPRVAQHGGQLEAPDRLRGGEQRLRRVHPHGLRDADRRTSPTAPPPTRSPSIADGMDFFDVYEKAGEAIERARRGEGPTLLECKTYRFYGHYVGDPLPTAPRRRAEDWIQNRDPLQALREPDPRGRSGGVERRPAARSTARSRSELRLR